MAVRTLSEPIWDMTSYQAPVTAFANFWPSGRLRTSVRTTRRSRISPGIFDESKIEVAPLVFRIWETSGFHVTTASCDVLVMKAVDISESEVFRSLTLLIW